MTAVRRLRSNAPDRFVTSIIVGAGQAGLAMSRCLADAGIEHVILERGEVANSWRTQRWDSLKLLSPNWQARLAGYRYDGDDPDGYMTVGEFIRYMDGYADTITAPIHSGVNVERVGRTQNGYRVVTNQGEWQCRTLVIANGASGIARIPALAANLASGIESLDPCSYRNPEQLSEGGVLVVGASASGLQLAGEIQASGRRVLLATGEQVRMPRLYRGRDIMWWMDRSGMFDLRYDEVDDIERSRRLPSSQLQGGSPRRNLDLNTVQDEGVEVLGRLAFLDGGRACFSGSLANVCKMADLKMQRLLKAIDEYAATREDCATLPEPDAPEAIRVSDSPRLEIDLRREGIRTVVWATGFRPDYSWLNVPVLDRKGALIHDGGVVDSPGLYVLGLPFMRRRKSQFIDGVADDARDLSAHMAQFLADGRGLDQRSVA